MRDLRAEVAELFAELEAEERAALDQRVYDWCKRQEPTRKTSRRQALPDRDQAVCVAWVRGESMAEIARRHEMTRMGVHKLLARCGLSTRRRELSRA